MKVTGDHAHVEFNAPYNDVTGTQINNYINQDEDRGREVTCSNLPSELTITVLQLLNYAH